MKKIYIFAFSLLFLFFSTIQSSSAQADTIMNFCSQYLVYPYISDGQQYRALVIKGEVAEFRATFYGGATYRIVACSGVSEGELIFRLYDIERNEIFASSTYNNTQYWDFKFNSTIDCIIEAELAPNASNSGFALLLIGFK